MWSAFRYYLYNIYSDVCGCEHGSTREVKPVVELAQSFIISEARLMQQLPTP